MQDRRRDAAVEWRGAVREGWVGDFEASMPDEEEPAVLPQLRPVLAAVAVDVFAAEIGAPDLEGRVSDFGTVEFSYCVLI